MANPTVYKIKILGWQKHNSKKKRHQEYIMLSTRFFDDAKVSTLSLVNQMLYLRCLLLAGDSSASDFEVSAETLWRGTRVPAQSIERGLMQLQEIQLLSYEKIQPLIKRKEIKRNEMNRNNLQQPQTPLVVEPKTEKKLEPKKDPFEKELNRKIWQSYFDAYRVRYGVDPVRNGRINGQVAQLGKRLGSEAVDVVAFYLTHNDGFYLKNSHALGLCLKDAESLHTQWKRGTKVTTAKVREFEKQAQFMDTIADIRENGI